jgi:hypothetical protein
MEAVSKAIAKGTQGLLLRVAAGYLATFWKVKTEVILVRRTHTAGLFLPKIESRLQSCKT